MKLQRPVFIAATISVTLLLANVVNSTISPDKFVSAYPAVVCAPTGSGLTSLVSVPSSKTKFRTVGVKTATFKKIKTSRYSQSGNPIIVDSKGVTPILWQARSGVWAGATICTAPISSQWFVGGASDVTSRGDLYLVNSGLSSAIADIEVWNENSAVASKVVTVKPNSSISVGLDSLAPGSKNIVLHVIARTGRLNTFLVDERGKGLKALGGDLVNSADAPTKEIYIPAIPHQVTKTGKKNPNSTHYLRILVPGDTSSNVSVELSSAEGSFVPIGLQDRKLENGKVYSIALSRNFQLKSLRSTLHLNNLLLPASTPRLMQKARMISFGVRLLQNCRNQRMRYLVSLQLCFLQGQRFQFQQNSHTQVGKARSLE